MCSISEERFCIVINTASPIVFQEKFTHLDGSYICPSRFLPNFAPSDEWRPK